MTPDQAAQVRATAWTASMRQEHTTSPRAASTCLCQAGPTTACQEGQHGRCCRPTPLPRPEGHIAWPDGRAARLPEPYTYPTPTATGPQHTTAVQVWLADRVCRWVCPCDCHTAVEKPTSTVPEPRPQPAPAPAAPVMSGWEQPNLFDLEPA